MTASRPGAGIHHPKGEPHGRNHGDRWSEIDLKAATWTIPERMKARRRALRVPLSDQALAT